MTEEKVLIPAAYAKKYHPEQYNGTKFSNPYLWGTSSVRTILGRQEYLGHTVLRKSVSTNFKLHKRKETDEDEQYVFQNTHEPIISQELWDKVQERMKSRAKGRRMHTGVTHPLSGFLYCADCGGKLKMGYVWDKKKNDYRYNFDCGRLKRYGKSYCFSHHITASVLEEIVLGDIRDMAQKIVLDEDEIKKEFIRQNAELADKSMKASKKSLQSKQKRVEELGRLIQNVYEDKVNGKMPEKTCFEFIDKYSAEKETLLGEIETLEENLKATESTKQTADDFIKAIKKYLNAPALTREMCYELIDRVIVGGLPKITGKERTIEIVYKVDIMSVLRHKLK